MTLTYRLTRAQLEKARADLATQGVTLTGDSGAIDHIIKANYSYDEASEALTINVTHIPMLVPPGAVKSKIDGWFASEAA
jgi:hypothetical protein